VLDELDDEVVQVHLGELDELVEVVEVEVEL
jgi:hypothetical protein